MIALKEAQLWSRRNSSCFINTSERTTPNLWWRITSRSVILLFRGEVSHYLSSYISFINNMIDKQTIKDLSGEDLSD